MISNWITGLEQGQLNLLAIIVLLAYRAAANRIRLLPRIPLEWFILFFAISFAAPFLPQISPLPDPGVWVQIAVSLSFSFAVVRLLVWLILEVPYRIQRRAALPKITRDFTLLVLFTVVSFVILRTQGNINIAGLITTSAVLTAVVGFAAQSPLSNFFAGLMIQMERPYVQGDWIRVGDHEGKVVNLTWKATYLETRESVQVYLPNLTIASSTFENFSKPDTLITARLHLGVEYGAPPEKVRRVVMEVLHQHPQVLSHPAAEVRLVNFGDFAITYEIRFWHRNFAGEPRIKADINNQLWYSLRRNGIKIPFPIRDVQLAHVEREREQKEMDEMRAGLSDRLRNVPILTPLSDAERTELADRLEVQVFGKGETIVEKGFTGSSMYIIREGRCAVLLPSPAGEKKVAELETGDYFGEMTLLTGEPRSATVRTLEDTAVFRITQQHFSTLLQGNPSVAEELGTILAKRQEQLARENPLSGGDVEPVSQFVARIKTLFNL